MTTETATKNDRSLRLIDKLFELKARRISAKRGPNQSTLEFWVLNGSVLIVQFFHRMDHYEVFAPITREISISATFNALEARAEED